MPNFSRFSDDIENQAVVVAFDPGETTGVCVLGVEPTALWGWDRGESLQNTRPLQECLSHVEYGEIDCGNKHGETGAGMQRGHASLNIKGENDGVDRMVNMLRYYHNPVVVMEDFIIDFNQITSARSALSPVRIMAAFSYGFREHIDKIFVQNRALVKTTCTNDRLKYWGLYDLHSGPHARDATRHAYYFLRECRGPSVKAQEFRWMAWPHLFSDPYDTVYDPRTATRKPRQRKIGDRI